MLIGAAIFSPLGVMGWRS